MATTTPAKTDAKQPETSVMMSLRELRAIDDQRREDEMIARERAIAEAARRVEEAAAAERAREAALIAARQGEDRRAQEAMAAAARETELRVKEAVVRAKAEVDALVAASRLDQEMELRRQQIARTRPLMMYAVVALFAAAAIAMAALYIGKAGANDALDAKLDQAKADKLAQEARIAIAEKARLGNEHVIAGLRERHHAVGEALLTYAPRPTTIAPTTPTHHGDHHGAHHGTPPGTGTGAAIDLGECAQQPLLCTK